MREVGVLEAKTNLSALIDEIGQGRETVVITRHGRPVARLIAIDADADGRPPRRFGDDDRPERLRRLRDEIARVAPELNELTPEDLKEMGRE